MCLFFVAAFMLCYTQDDPSSEGISISSISIVEFLVGKVYFNSVCVGLVLRVFLSTTT